MPRTMAEPAPTRHDAGMPTFTHYIDQYVRDKQRQGTFNSPRTELDYRRTLELHAEDVNNRDPANVERKHIKITLNRWDSCSPTSVAKYL